MAVNLEFIYKLVSTYQDLVSSKTNVYLMQMNMNTGNTRGSSPCIPSQFFNLKHQNNHQH